MKNIPESELEKLIEFGAEARNREFKRSCAWAGDFKIKLTKSMMAMSNLRDGGMILFGMEEQDDGSFIPKGVQDEHVNTFKQDHIRDFNGDRADPNVDFDLLCGSYKEKKYLVINVKPFSYGPVICKKDEAKLNKGDIYFRTSNRRYQSAKISSESDMREIIEIAVDRRDDELNRRGRWVCPISKSEATKAIPNTEKRKFNEQYADLEEDE